MELGNVKGGRRRSLVGLGVAGLVLALVPGASAQTSPGDADVVVEAARQVTTAADPVRLFVSPSMAVHPDDPRTLAVAVADARNGGCGLRVSNDGGLSWAVTAPSVMPADSPFCIQRNFGQAIDLAFARDGTLYLAMSGSSPDSVPAHPNGPISPMVARTTDLGTTHDVTTIVQARTGTYTLRDGTQAEGVEHHKLNSIAVDPADPERVYRGWRLAVRGVEQEAVPGWSLGSPTQGLPSRSMVATSGDGGRTWSEPFDLTTAFPGPPFGSDLPMMAVGPDGTAYAFTKEAPDRVPSGQDAPRARLLMARSTDNGRTWTGRVIDAGQVRLGVPVPAIDQSNGNLYLVWEQQGASRDLPGNVFFMASTDGGETWTTPRDLTDDDPSREFNQYQPGISVAPNGRIDVAWHDFRNDPFFTRTASEQHGAVGERYSDVYYAYSNDGGRTWSENIRVTDRSIDRDVGVTFNNNDIRAPLAIASTEDAALLAWPDSRAGSDDLPVEDTYFTRVRHATPALVGDTGDDSLVAPILLGVGLGLAVAGAALILWRVVGSGDQPARAVRA